MTLKQLEYFMAVARTLNFTDAAEEMQVSQPALSRSIASLEEELAVTLLERDHHSVSLTRAGQKLAAELPKLSMELENLMTQLKQTENGLMGRLNIGLVQGQRRTEALAQTFSYFTQSLPSVEINPLWTDAYTLNELLLQGKVDVICTTNADIVNYSGVEYSEMDVEPFCVLVPNWHRMAGSRFTTLSVFANDTFLVEETASHDGDVKLLTEQCQKAGFKPKLRRVSDYNARIFGVESGTGVSVFNILCEVRTGKNTRSIPLTDVKPARFLLAWRKDNPNPCVRIFTHMTACHFEE